MPQIPQISTPHARKDYGAGLANRQPGENAEQFDIIHLNKPLEVETATERDAGGRAKASAEGREFLPMSVKIAKDPTSAVESLKQIVGGELLTAAKTNGYTELHGEVETLMESIYLSPEQLVEEITMQEKQTTMFTGDKLFDMLRQLAGTASNMNNEDMKAALGNFLKAVNYTQNKDEILNALSSNLKFLSQYFAPNKALSNDLQTLSNQFASADAGKYFELLKNETLSVLGNVSSSLLNNERTQVLIPLIVHNLSRYNTNPDMLGDYFSQLMGHVPSEAMRGEMKSAFDQIFGALMNNQNQQNAQAAPQQGAGQAQTPQTQNPAQNPSMPGQPSQASPGGAPAGQPLPGQPQNLPGQPLPNQAQSPTGQPLPDGAQLPGQFAENTVQNNHTPNQSINQPQNGQFIEQSGQNAQISQTNGQMTPQNAPQTALQSSKIPEFLSNRLNDYGYMQELAYDDGMIDVPVRAFLLGKTSGMEAIREILDYLILEPPMKQALSAEMEQIGSIDTLVNYLNDILSKLPADDEWMHLYDNLTELVGGIADKEELLPEALKQSLVQEEAASSKKSVLDDLIGFVERNIDHSAMKSINNYNASNLLQSLINAPGVFTPLAHYIIPLEIEDTRAFGELWVDSDEENQTAGVGGKKNYHLFLTFDIDAIGRFEIDMYASGNEVNLSLLHPESFAEKITPIVKKVNRIVAQSGYTAREFRTGPLRAPHNLTQVFPDIMERRAGLNVKA